MHPINVPRTMLTKVADSGRLWLSACAFGQRIGAGAKGLGGLGG